MNTADRSSTKVLYLPLNYDEFPAGTLKAFQSVFGSSNVCVFDYLDLSRKGYSHEQINAGLLKVVEQFEPRIVHTQLQETGVITPATLATIRRKAFVTTWMGDCRVSVPETVASVARECDMVLVSNTGQLDEYRKKTGAECAYWQTAADWDRDFVHRGEPSPLDKNIRFPKVLFSGNHYPGVFPGSPERLAVVEACAKAFGDDFAVVGSGFPSHIRCLGSHPRSVQKWFYQESLVSIGVGNFNHVGNFYSERQFQAMASGRPHVCANVPGLFSDFRSEELMVFDNPDECVSTVKYLLDNPDDADVIGQKGRAAILSRHTWLHRVEEYVAILARSNTRSRK